MSRKSKSATAPLRLPETTFVIDNGAWHIKAGFAPQEDESDEAIIKKCQLVPNAIVRSRDRKTYIGAQAEENIAQWSETVFRRPVEHGHIVSWEAEKAIWEHSFFNSRSPPGTCVNEPGETTMILGESPNMLPALQKNADEIIMEEFGFGGYMRTTCKWASAA